VWSRGDVLYYQGIVLWTQGDLSSLGMQQVVETREQNMLASMDSDNPDRSETYTSLSSTASAHPAF
jgi:hypothetical protein